jgi:hypothetical protein
MINAFYHSSQPSSPSHLGSLPNSAHKDQSKAKREQLFKKMKSHY